MKDGTEKAAWRGVAGLLTVMLTAAIAVVAWGANRSLGLGDDGVYLLAARYPKEIEQNVSAVFVYTGAIFRIVGYDPQLFRLAGLSAIILSALAFWAGYQKLVMAMIPSANKIPYMRTNTLLFTQLGAVLYYQWAFMTPTYYTLTAIALNVFAGFVMWGLAYENRAPGSRLTVLLFAIAGLALGAGVFVRFTSAALMLGCLIVVLWFWPSVGRLRRLFFLLIVGGGMTAWSGLHFLFVQAPARQWDMFIQGWDLYQLLGSYSPAVKIFQYPRDLRALVASATLMFWPCHTLVAVSLVLQRFRSERVLQITPPPHSIAAAVLALATVLSVKMGVDVIGSRQPTGVGWYTLGMPGYLSFYSGWIIVLLSLYVLFVLQPAALDAQCNRSSMQSRGLALFLLGLPVAGSVGTNNPLYNVISFYAAPWFGLLFLIGFTLVNRHKMRLTLLSAILVVVGGVATSQIVQGSILTPSLIPTSLQKQSVPTELGYPPHWMKLDRDTHNVVQELRTAAARNGFHPGDDIVAVSYLPGLVYAMGGRSPGHPTFLLGTPGFFAYSKMALTFAKQTDLERAFVLIDREQEDNELRSLLASAALNFPAGYIVISEVSGNGKTYRLYKPITEGINYTLGSKK